MVTEQEDSCTTPHSGSRIGIVAGSGSEAGIDLWNKLLRASKASLGDTYRGDVDAPYVIICSSPSLGLSMDMAKHKELVWSELSRTLVEISSFVDCICIACYTMHVFEDQIHTLGLSAEFVSLVGEVVKHLASRNYPTVGLLTAGAITSSPSPLLAALDGQCEVERAADPEAVRQLIFDIKAGEPRSPEIVSRFERIIRGMDSEIVILGCTELSLVQIEVEGKELVDGVKLLAGELARRARSSSQESMSGRGILT